MRYVGVAAENLRAEEWSEAVNYARQLLTVAQQQRTSKRETAWKQSEQQYQGDQWATTPTSQDPTADLITINISFSTVNTIVPYISGSDPNFVITPWSLDATMSNARAQEAWLNRWWQSLDSGAARAVQSVAFDSLIYGDGYAKVSYKFSKEGQYTKADIMLDAVDPWNIWVDPMARDFIDARWVCEKIRTTKEELEDSGLYDALPDDLLGIDQAEIATEDEAHFRPADDGKQWVDIYEFWDRIEDRLIVFGAAGDRPLRVIEQAKCPIINLPNHWLPKMPYHMGELEQIWSLQQELNKSRSQMLTHRRRNIPKFLVKADVLDAETEDALTSQVVNQMVKIKGDRPLMDVIQAIGLTPLTSEQYNVSDLIQRDVYEVTGVNEYLRGATPEIRRTATEASIIEGASNIKTAHKLRKVEQFTRLAATLVLGFAADVFPVTDYEETALLISGRDAEAINKAAMREKMDSIAAKGAKPEVLAAEMAGTPVNGDVEVSLGADMFVGVYNIEVLQNSTELRNPIFKEQKFREMAVQLAQLAPGLMQFGVNLNLRRVFELWFEAAGILDVDAMFQQPQPPAPMGMGGMPPQPGMGQQQGPGDLSSLVNAQPNLASAVPPTEALSALNTGQMPPA